MINFSACRLEKGENLKCCPFLQALGKKRVRHSRDKSIFQSAACPATLKVLADHQVTFGQDCCIQISIFKGKGKERSQTKMSLLSHPFICMEEPVSHLSFHLFFAHLQIKAIMARPSQGDILGNLLSLAEITAVCYLKYNGRDWDVVWGFSQTVSLEMDVSLPCRRFNVPAVTWEALMVPGSHLSELQEQIQRYRDCSSLLATAAWNLWCLCYITPLLSTISIFLLCFLVHLSPPASPSSFLPLTPTNLKTTEIFLPILHTPLLPLSLSRLFPSHNAHHPLPFPALLCLCQPSPSQTLLVVSR